MHENFEITFSKETCTHHDTCGCKVRLKGIGKYTSGMDWEGSGGTLTSQYLDAACYINSVETSPGNPKKEDYNDEVEYFRSQIKMDSTIRLIPSPLKPDHSWPESKFIQEVDPRVRVALKRADIRYLHFKFPQLQISWLDMQKYVWVEDKYGWIDVVCKGEGPPHRIWGTMEPVLPLQWMLIRRESMYHWALGKTNGRLHAVSAAANLYPRKLAKAILTMARPTMGETAKQPLQYIDMALDHLYSKMKIDLTKKEKNPLSFKPLDGMYLGSSNGLNPAEKKVINDVSIPSMVVISGKGKKIDTYEQDMAAVMEFLTTGKEPFVGWTVPEKDEMFFDFFKQWDDQSYAVWQDKLRVFNIPSSVFIFMEKMVSTFRHLKERGWVIRVGHPWSRGGAQSLAQCLGIDLQNCFEKLIVEGDVKKFDQTVIDYFINLYFSTMLIHEDKSHPDHPYKERIVRFLLSNMITRITKLFGDVWGVVRGGVPSGAFNTSHMDSWIMALYFCLFGVYQIMNAPPEQREQLEEDFVRCVYIIVYGDDFLYNKGRNLSSVHFSGVAFMEFMEKHFGVLVRDLKDGVAFCSKVKDGWVWEMGATMLKHQMIVNPEIDRPGQATFLPFRESREFMVRALWGRVGRFRDPVDIMLSVLGHAYGTYAANRDAYDRLHVFYAELMREINIEDLEGEMKRRISFDDLKKLRQTGLTVEELVSGFPSWEALITKNTYDAVYQNISLIPDSFFEDLHGVEDIFAN